ncbi:unnamed protein product [Adineta ricciae]|uniref:Uncharacterized protein n=1 Tax=Adineta ricciae TaxID=249248 RepID=A0A814GB19_ADIRI|nr:unnamed protein product [Adineta ricciae]
MKAALAIIFFACVAGSMAADARLQIVDQLLAQGQGIAQQIFSQLQATILATIQSAVGQISAAIGGRFDFNEIVNQFKPILEQLAGQALSQVLGSLSGIFGGSRIDLASIFGDFWSGISTQVTELGQHFLNQGLAAVLGGLGGLGSRGFSDIFASLSQSIGTAVTAAQGALTGALGGLQQLGSQILDASKPHWEQLQEQLVGHGLNVLGSLSETINNVHGSIVGGR